MAVAAQPGFVVQSFREEDVHQCRAPARRRSPDSGAMCRSADRAVVDATGVDDDDVGAVALRVTQDGHEVGRGAGGIVSPDEDQSTVEDIAGVRRRIAAEGHL